MGPAEVEFAVMNDTGNTIIRLWHQVNSGELGQIEFTGQVKITVKQVRQEGSWRSKSDCTVMVKFQTGFEKNQQGNLVLHVGKI